MYFNAIKSIVFICLLAMLNACGIGRYHSLNLVRPDKKTSITLVSSKHKTNKVTEVIKEDSAIAQINEESGLIKTANIVSERKETLIIPFLKKPSQNAKKVKVGLKEKVVMKILKNKSQQNKKNDPYFFFLVLILAVSLLTLGVIFLFISTLPALLLLIASLFFWLIALTTAEIRFILAYATWFLLIIPLIIGIVFLFIDLPIALWVIGISLILLLIFKFSFHVKWPFG